MDMLIYTRSIMAAALVAAFTTPIGLSAQVVRDSAGIQIIRAPAPLEPPRIITPNWFAFQIGSVDGSDHTDFATVLTACILADGHIAAVDLQGREVRIFEGAEGRHVRTIGREGGGPGEFRAAPTIAAAENGGIWAWDPGSRRLSRFDADGQLVDELPLNPVQMRGAPNAFTLSAWGLSPSGLLLSLASRDRRAKDAITSDQTVLLIDHREPAPIHVGRRRSWTQAYDGQYAIADPFVTPTSAAVIGEWVYASGAGSWQLDVYGKAGSLHRIIRYPIARLPVTHRLIAAEKIRLSELTDGAEFVRLFEELELADSASAIRRLKASSDGLLWVERWHPHDLTADEVWDVLNPDGTWLRTITIPAGAGSFLDARANLILTVYHDELGVPYIRMYRVPESP